MEQGEAQGEAQASALWARRRKLFMQTHLCRLSVEMYGPEGGRRRVIAAASTAGRNRPRSWPEPLPRLQEAEEEQAPSDQQDAAYRLWLANKKRQRADLEAMADVKSWIDSKIGATDLELRVLESLERKPEAGEPVPEPEHQPKHKKRTRHKRYSKPVSVHLPTLEPVKRLHEYLSKKRLRFVDFFRTSDPGKKGKLSKDDILAAFKKINLPITDLQIKELIENFGDHTKCIRYKVLAQALNTWREELRQEIGEKVYDLPKIAASSKRPNKAASVAKDEHDVPRHKDTLPVPTVEWSENRPLTDGEMEQLKARDQETKIKKTSKRHHTDLMERCLYMKGEDRSIACHSLPTTLGGEMGEATNAFRRRCLMEYRKILKMCRFYGIAFTEKMLTKALLHPGDKLTYIPGQRVKLRQPGTNVVSKGYAERWHVTRQRIIMDRFNRKYALKKEENQINIAPNKSQLEEASEEPESELRYPERLMVDNLNQESKHTEVKVEVGMQQDTSQLEEASAGAESKLRYPERFMVDNLNQESKHTEVKVEVGMQQDTSQLEEASEEAESKLRQLIIVDELTPRKEMIQIKVQPDNNQLKKPNDKLESTPRIAAPQDYNMDASVPVPTSSTQKHMTPEDYVKFKRKLKGKLPSVASPVQDVFWPGRMLEKVRMYLPNAKLQHEEVLFSKIQKGTTFSSNIYHNEKTWPISDQGYLMYGDIERKKRYML
ncbi:EF-hand calcium-binding domain-containing protein 12 isoform X2 [Amblyraja radiata]|uniref:EF-hand calcium-binding domain-containing protein 12 isoform X2 n=1 Tax=Amblyraja radiata TaxID=386614 RepID=UPI001402E179|nr:EF-hand calcium-binding domain-containing protein 12 isoform X2 [Amblyraja radiata]